jgi:hypothetical protein
MQTFLGLIIAPLLALGCQSLMFSLVTPSCSMQTRVAMHVVALAVLAVNLVLTALAWRDWSLHGARSVDRDERSSGPTETRRFLAASATAVAALSSLLVLMMWFAAWALSPCQP